MGEPLPARSHGPLLQLALRHPLHRLLERCVQHLRPHLRSVDGGAEVLSARLAARRGPQVRRQELHRRLPIDLRLASP